MIAALGQEIKQRLQTVSELQGMSNDAQLARDQTKVCLNLSRFHPFSDPQSVPVSQSFQSSL